MSQRDQRTQDIIKELAAEFLQRESNGTSLITVTGVQMLNKLTKALVLVTVLPDNKEDAALEFINRKRTDFRNYIKDHSRLQKLPIVHFAIDYGEKNRQRIDELSSETTGDHLEVQPPSQN